LQADGDSMNTAATDDCFRARPARPDERLAPPRLPRQSLLLELPQQQQQSSKVSESTTIP
jgi:hypothetical protein